MDRLEDKLNELAELCGETTGASFMITRLKDRTWKIQFPNSGKLRAMTGSVLFNVTLGAIDEVKLKRTIIEVETKYTVYDN